MERYKLAGVNGTSYYLAGILTNAGTISMVSGNLGPYNPGCGDGLTLLNLPGALIDMTADVSIEPGASGCTGTLLNQGTVRKSGGTGTSTINPTFNNSGTLDVQTGTVSVSGGGNGNSNGVFQTEAGATLLFPNNYAAYSGVQFTGIGTNLLTGGTFMLNGLITISNLTLAGAYLDGTNAVIAGLLTWTSGRPADATSLTLATNGVLVLAGNNGTDYLMGNFTNAGTIRLQSGNFSPNGYQGVQVINLPIGLIDIVTNVSMDNYNGGVLVNYGTVRKSGGTGTSTINPTFNNSGTLDVQTGTVSVSGGGNGNSNGVFQTEAGATLLFPNNYAAYSGVQFTGIGTNLLTGGTFMLNGLITISNLTLAGAYLDGTNAVIAGLLTWTSGRPADATSLTLATNGVLVLAGNNGTDYLMGNFTNAGTIRLQSGNFSPNGYQGVQVINLPIGLIDIVTNVSMDNYNGGVLVNYGTVRKSGGTGTSTINPTFNNSGTLDVQTGTVSLQGSYTLTGGTLNFGINSLTSYGTINLHGSAALTGTVSANLNNGFVPIGGDIFPVLSYGSRTGIFTNTILPLPDSLLWQTNYYSTYFTLTVLNVRPTPVPIPNQTVDELSTLIVNAAATDPDIPAQTLTFGLASAPSGMTISPSSGTISWTPVQTQSPSTNTVVWTVTDNGTPPLAATNSFIVVVVEVNVPPLLPAISNQTAYVANPFTVTNTATEFNIHSTTTGYSLVGAPLGMTIDTNGIITWTPTQGENGTTNLITTVVANSNPYDTVNPQLTATNSFTVIVSPAVPPTITSQPTNATVLVGDTTNFTVTVSGTPPFGYQWYFYAATLTNGTNAILTLAAVTTNNTGNYSVIITNAYGSATSSVATLNVQIGAPTIVTQPQSVSVFSGQSAAFNVVANGSLPLSYQWRKGGTNLVDGGEISGSASNTLMFSSTTTNDTANYTVAVTNAYGSVTSIVASLTVIPVVPPLGGLTNIYFFNGTNGDDPETGLILGADGNFYGTTRHGGVLYQGTVFKLTPDGTLSTVYTFTNCNPGGCEPIMLIQGSDGNLYGMANGGIYYSSFSINGGLAYRVSPGGAFNIVHTFTYPGEGAPTAGDRPVQTADGNFYGVTGNGGANYNAKDQYGNTVACGTVYRMDTNGNLTTLFSFSGGNGCNPTGPLMQGSDGNLYGTTLGGIGFAGLTARSIYSGYGTIFRMTTNGDLTTLVYFNGNNGDTPSDNGLVQGNDGNLYGTTEYGGTNGYGTVFKLTTNGTLTTLHSFTGGNDGYLPYCTMIQAADGNFYGTTLYGGTNNLGTVFEITTNGSFTSLISFDQTHGAYPARVKLAPDGNGNLYGTTSAGGPYNDGTIFRLAIAHNTPVAAYHIKRTGTILKTDIPGATVSGGGSAVFNGLYTVPEYWQISLPSSLRTSGNQAFFAMPDSAANENGVGAATSYTIQWYSGIPSSYLTGLPWNNPPTSIIGESSDFVWTNGAVDAVTGKFVPVELIDATPVIQGAVTQGNGSFAFSWNAFAGQIYQVQYKTNLVQTDWINLGSPITATNGTLTVSDLTTNTQQFYRVVLVQ